MSKSFMLSKPVFLCGMMGSGKSTVARVLAEKMELSFTDLDQEIEKQEGMSIPEIFRRKGECGFRETEKRCLLQAAGKTGGIIALGGGALQNQELIDHLKLSGWLIFLDAPRSVLLNRLSSDESRPLLKKTDGGLLQKKIDKLLKERKEFYHQSHFIIDTGSDTPEMIADTIVNKLKMHET